MDIAMDTNYEEHNPNYWTSEEADVDQLLANMMGMDLEAWLEEQDELEREAKDREEEINFARYGY
jgi:hypothetical protein